MNTSLELLAHCGVEMTSLHSQQHKITCFPHEVHTCIKCCSVCMRSVCACLCASHCSVSPETALCVRDRCGWSDRSVNEHQNITTKERCGDFGAQTQFSGKFVEAFNGEH